MKDYYTPLKPLHEAVKRAVKNIEAFRCSQLGQEVYDIKNTFNGLKIDASNWGDSVADSFVEVKNQFVKHFGDIVDSIDGEFSESEKIYRELDEDLEMLYRTNEAYHEYATQEPKPENYYQEITRTNPLTGEQTSRKVRDTEAYNAAHQEWQGYFDGLKDDLDELEAKINEEKARLDEINDISISVDNINTSVGDAMGSFSDALIANEKILYEKIFETDGTREGNAKVIWNFLKYKGLSDAAIAGVLGNIQAECHFDPDLYEQSSKVSQRRKGYGLIQWTNYKGQKGGRRDRLFAAAEKAGADPSSLQFQLEYLWSESLDPNSGYGKSLQKAGFYTTDDPGDAAYYFHKYVEISADSKSAIQNNRVVPAEKWYNEFHGRETLSI